MFINKVKQEYLMVYLTEKDVKVLKIIERLKKETKSNVARNSEYLYSGLDHTFKKLKKNSFIKITQVKHNSIVELTKKGNEVLART